MIYFTNPPETGSQLRDLPVGGAPPTTQTPDPLLAPQTPLRTCKRCGCTDSAACAGGCAWATPDLCTECVPHITLNGWQLQAALDFAAPDRLPEQMDEDQWIQYFAAGQAPRDDDGDGNSLGDGYFCCSAEYPEEGWIPLSPQARNSNDGDAVLTTRPAPAEPPHTCCGRCKTPALPDESATSATPARTLAGYMETSAAIARELRIVIDESLAAVDTMGFGTVAVSDETAAARALLAAWDAAAAELQLYLAYLGQAPQPTP